MTHFRTGASPGRRRIDQRAGAEARGKSPGGPAVLHRDRVKLYGLTGGIASGKSTVAGALRSLGATVVDADQLARDVVAPGQPALEEIRARWPDVVAADGTLDRKALGAVVFADPAARQALEAITHPRIGARSAQLLSEARERGEPVAFYEAALLVEKGLDEGFDGLVVVSVPESVQLQRLMARDGLDEEAARQRLAAQAPLSRKLERATDVVDNAGDLAQTRAQVEALWKKLSAPTRGEQT